MGASFEADNKEKDPDRRADVFRRVVEDGGHWGVSTTLKGVEAVMAWSEGGGSHISRDEAYDILNLAMEIVKGEGVYLE